MVEEVVEKIKEILKQNGYTKRFAGPNGGFNAWVIQDVALVQVHDGSLEITMFVIDLNKRRIIRNARYVLGAKGLCVEFDGQEYSGKWEYVSGSLAY